MDKVVFNKREYEVIKQISESKYLICYKGKDSVLVVYNEEDYDNFLLRYKELKISGISIPKMIKKDKKEFKILFEYLNECENVLHFLISQPINELLLTEIFKMAWYARHSNINIDYHPDNFVIYKNQLYYLPFKVTRGFDKARSFEIEGIRWWFYTKEFYAYCASKGFTFDKNKIKDEYKTNKDIVLAVCRYQR